MPDNHISVPVCTLSTAVLTARNSSNTAQLCRDALTLHAEGSAKLTPTIETLQILSDELQQLHIMLDQFVITELARQQIAIPFNPDEKQEGVSDE